MEMKFSQCNARGSTIDTLERKFILARTENTAKKERKKLCSGIFITIKRTTALEAGFFRNREGLIKGLPKTPPTSQQYCTGGFEGAPQLGTQSAG